MKKAVDIRDLQIKIALYEDMQAYRSLHDFLFEGLYSFSYAFVKSKEAAEEIVSDVFVKIWQIRNRLIEIEHLKEYLYTITKNFSLNYIAKNYKYPVVNLDDIDIETIIEIKTPEELYISADIVARIRQSISELSPRCRIIFQLVKEDNLSYKEVASILNISVFTVRNQIAIATKKLAAALPSYVSSIQIRS